MKELAKDLERWHARGEKVALATVVSARRSAPRPIGSKLAVSESGELAGSVSGGCVEGDVFGEAREVLAGSAPRLLEYGISDELAFSVGLPCGGDIEVFVAEEDPLLSARLLEAIERGERATHVVAIRGERVGEQARPGASEHLLRDAVDLVLDTAARDGAGQLAAGGHRELGTWRPRRRTPRRDNGGERESLAASSPAFDVSEDLFHGTCIIAPARSAVLRDPIRKEREFDALVKARAVAGLHQLFPVQSATGSAGASPTEVSSPRRPCKSHASGRP